MRINVTYKEFHPYSIRYGDCIAAPRRKYETLGVLIDFTIQSVDCFKNPKKNCLILLGEQNKTTESYRLDMNLRNGRIL